MSLLAVRECHKHYDKAVLSDINFTLDVGETVVLMGPSGCGKSTLLNLLIGSETPSTGGVYFLGRTVRQVNHQASTVFQSYSLMPHLTVLDNLMLATAAMPAAKAAVYRRTALESLERLKLQNTQHQYPGELSGGMRQRLALITPVLSDNSLLFLDEAFSALDRDTQAVAYDFLLDHLKARPKGVLLITHNAQEACYLGTRLMLLSQYYTNDLGAKGTGGRLIGNYPLPRHRLREGETLTVSQALQATKVHRQAIDCALNPGTQPLLSQVLPAFTDPLTV